MEKRRIYLGDSVYMWFDGFHIILETDNGDEATNTIHLELRTSLELVIHGSKEFELKVEIKK